VTSVRDSPPEPIQQILNRYDEVRQFRVEIDLVNVQALGITITEDLDFEYLDEIDGDAAFYHHPDVEGGVMMYAQGIGFYCAHDMDDLEAVEKWFTIEFGEYKGSPIRVSTFDDMESQRF
jgi:hypothetical protein